MWSVQLLNSGRLMWFRPIVVMAILMSLGLTACGRGDTTAVVPRRVAYPRVEVCDSVYDVKTIAGKSITVNAEAELSIGEQTDSSTWIDVGYRRYGATLRLTLMSPREIKSAMANRLERIRRNVGDLPTRVTELSSSGVEGIVVETQGGGVTPLQLLATDNSSFVLSGVVEVADSVVPFSYIEAAAPVVASLRRDMICLVEGLSLGSGRVKN